MQRLMTFVVVSLFVIHLARSQDVCLDSAQMGANEYMLQNSHEALVRAFDSSERDSWQHPDTVISFLGDLTNKTIVDLGSGSGYFTFRLLSTGAKVIAADVDEEFLEIIKEKGQKLNIEEDRLKTIHIDNDKLNIEEGTVDIIFLVNVYHHISDRISYFSRANSVLKKDGKIIIIDFYKKTLPIGPPKNHKISEDLVIEELEKAGYENIALNTDLLQYQYLIVADQF